jgi:hypothetical protein
MITVLTLTENLKSTGSLHIRKMDLHDGVCHKKSAGSSHKIFYLVRTDELIVSALVGRIG